MIIPIPFSKSEKKLLQLRFDGIYKYTVFLLKSHLHKSQAVVDPETDKEIMENEIYLLSCY